MAVTDTLKDLASASTKKKINVDQSQLDKNMLHQYASYNYLFTLSGLTEPQLQKPSRIIGQRPHNIIARSSGIIDPKTSERKDLQDYDESFTLNTREKAGLDKAQSTLNQGRDIYFESVDIQSVHSFNPERRSSAIGKIRMVLNEPSGVTILEKLKAVAYNCGYKDHVDAPYLLSLEFKGFDEKGVSQKLDPNKGKKWIPIKIVKMQIRVNTGGARYEVDAIPYNEAGFLNRYNFTRTTINLEKATDIGRFLNHLTGELNKQTKDEAEKYQLFTPGMQDKYVIKIDDKFDGIPLNVNSKNNNLNTVPVVDYAVLDESLLSTDLQAPSQTYKFGSKAGDIPAGTSIIKLLEDAMLTLKPVQDVVQNWINTMSNKIRQADSRKTVLTSKDFENLDDNDYYIDWFMVRSKIDTDTGRFDKRTMQHPKTITYYIEPYRIHVFRLVRPGVTIGQSKNVLVKKKYDYIFTGNNTDILDLDINYKIAYYQTKLRPETSDTGESGVKPNQSLGAFGSDTDLDNGLGLRSYPAGVKNSNIIRGTEAKAEADLFQDALANPQADMVKVDLKIIGDPAWIGMSQFFDINLKDKNPGPGTTTDEKKKELGADKAWNDTYGCFNVETHDPVIRLNFVMPGDLSEQKGIYEIGKTNSSAFSGLYQVYKVSSDFTNGAFTQTLHMTRFKNQSEGSPSKTTPVQFVIDPNNRIISLSEEIKDGKILDWLLKESGIFHDNASSIYGGPS